MSAIAAYRTLLRIVGPAYVLVCGAASGGRRMTATDLPTDPIERRRALGIATLGLDVDPHLAVGERTVLHLAVDCLEVSVERFSHSDEPRFTGNRGTVMAARTGHSGNVFTDHLPDLFVSDNGDVEIGDVHVPAGIATAWLRAALAHIEERTPAARSDDE